MRLGSQGLILVMLLLSGGALRAQQPTPPGGDPIGNNLFPPELVMQHQQEIGLTEEQRNFVIGEIQTAQRAATPAQWQLQREMETMASLLKRDPIDETRMLAQLDRILAAEREVKHIQLTLLVRVKNRLTPEQLNRLRELRASTPR